MLWSESLGSEEEEEGGVWSPATEEADELYPEDSPATRSRPAPRKTSSTRRGDDLSTYTAWGRTWRVTEYQNEYK